MNKQIQEQEIEATEYANELIKTHEIKSEREESTFGVQGLWQETVLNFLKEKALNFVGTTLKHLAINHLVDLAEWLLQQLESYLLEQYQNSKEEERQLFLRKIKENFPNSELVKKLESK